MFAQLTLRFTSSGWPHKTLWEAWDPSWPTPTLLGPHSWAVILKTENSKPRLRLYFLEYLVFEKYGKYCTQVAKERECSYDGKDRCNLTS
jgi:hypothetical protein